MTTTEQSHARIKWLLIALSVFVAVGAFLLVWVPYQRQVRVIEEIEAMGVPNTWIKLEPVGPEWLRELVGDERMKGFDGIDAVVLLAGAPIDDAWLKRLGHLPSLQELYLSRTQISDDGLKHLTGLTKLEVLSLTGTQVTDDGLKHIAHLTNLQSLLLDGTQIIDDGVKHLAGLSSLRFLTLDRTLISDDGLKHLSGLTGLESLSLAATEVSDDGVRKLRQALPDCTISRDRRVETIGRRVDRSAARGPGPDVSGKLTP